MNSVTTTSMNSGRQASVIEVFLVEDYQPVLRGLAKLIQGEYPRMHLVGTASTHTAALAGIIRQQPDVVLLDHGLGNGGALDFLSHLAVLGRHRILMLIGHNTLMRLGVVRLRLVPAA